VAFVCGTFRALCLATYCVDKVAIYFVDGMRLIKDKHLGLFFAGIVPGIAVLVGFLIGALINLTGGG